jgi:hypothetical protein
MDWMLPRTAPKGFWKPEEPLTAWDLPASLGAGVLRGSKKFISHQTQFQLLGELGRAAYN